MTETYPWLTLIHYRMLLSKSNKLGTSILTIRYVCYRRRVRTIFHAKCMINLTSIYAVYVVLWDSFTSLVRDELPNLKWKGHRTQE